MNYLKIQKIKILQINEFQKQKENIMILWMELMKEALRMIKWIIKELLMIIHL